MHWSQGCQPLRKLAAFSSTQIPPRMLNLGHWTDIRSWLPELLLRCGYCSAIAKLMSHASMHKEACMFIVINTYIHTYILIHKGTGTNAHMQAHTHTVYAPVPVHSMHWFLMGPHESQCLTLLGPSQTIDMEAGVPHPHSGRDHHWSTQRLHSPPATYTSLHAAKEKCTYICIHNMNIRYNGERIDRYVCTSDSFMLLLK